MVEIDIKKVIDIELGAISETSSGIFREIIIRTKDGNFTITVTADSDDAEIKIFTNKISNCTDSRYCRYMAKWKSKLEEQLKNIHVNEPTIKYIDLYRVSLIIIIFHQLLIMNFILTLIY